MKDNSTTLSPANKAALLKKARAWKKRERFPLLAHATLRWARKINGALFYYGPITATADFGAALALAEYHRVVEDDRAGRARRPVDDGRLTLRTLCNAFRAHKLAMMEAGEITERTFGEYQDTTDRLIATFGRGRAVEDLRPEDFGKLRAKMAKRWGPVRLANGIQYTRSVFKYGYDSGLLDRPVRFGPEFAKPSAKVLRRNRARRGPRLFEPAELRAILDESCPTMRAMLLLAINGGMGNSEVASLPVDLPVDGDGFLTGHREKTGVSRRFWLWLETRDAVEAYRKVRPKPKNPADTDLLFIGRYGTAYLGERTGNRVTQLFKAARDKAGVAPDRTFYDARRTFETIGGDTGDQVCVDFCMGHAPKGSDMGAVYRQRVNDTRVRAVCEHVRHWLFPPRPDAELV